MQPMRKYCRKKQKKETWTASFYQISTFELMIRSLETYVS